MDYKQTLLLPSTPFAMRGNLPQNEPKRFQKWSDEKAYEKMLAKEDQRQTHFNLHDGPPYANGHLHIGHALNKVLKDIITKTHYFFGDAVTYVPGWDCHGLPIEQKVEEKIGAEKKKRLEKSKIRELCRGHAGKFLDIQKEEFKSLGVIGDWDNPYKTMDFAFEANIYRALCDIAKQGLLVQRSKPVYWSWAAKSALAEAEVEYEDKEDYSIYVAFKLSSDAKKALDIEGDASIVIWTTTPWTLPANVGIALNPDEEYVLSADGFVVAAALHQGLFEKQIVGSVVKRFAATTLENTNAINPLSGRDSRIVLGDHVMMDGGSGCVHTAPGHGEDDYVVGLKYNLEVIMPVDDDGKYDQTVVSKALFNEPEQFVGMHIFEANEKILELLGDALLHSSRFTHSYPFCWRTHKPVIYRATKQWFVAMDKVYLDGKTLREVALEQIEATKFYPASGKNRLKSMIENRPDWCISRQRDWGVPIAFFVDKTTKEPIFDEKVMHFTAMIFEQHGCDAWWSMDTKDLLYPGSGLDPNNLEKVMDILDVWFDSGSTWKAVLQSQKYNAGSYPASMYLEGSDQHRGWFQSSLLVSCAINGKVPYHSILTHGFTVDEKGEKMSKSKGNVVAPEDVAKKYGVEILRLWVALSDYSSDLKISDNILKQISEQYRKLRNTFRFLLANINDLEEIADVQTFSAIDRWIISEASRVFAEVQKHFQNYDFAKGYSLINNFVVNELSGIYLDISKDRLYCNSKDDSVRVSAQSAMALITQSLMALVAPVLTHTIDEIIETAPKVITDAKIESVFDLEYQPLPYVHCDIDKEYIIEAREKFFNLVDDLKKKKTINSTLEVVLQTNSQEFTKMSKTDAEDWFTVSKVIAHEEEGALGTFTVSDDRFVILKAAKHKCPRCWKFRAKLEDAVCPRCEVVIHNG
jgi:isoleucyl-tRNA synthetase